MISPLRPTANRRFNELVALLLLVCASLLFLSLISFHPSDPSPDTAPLVHHFSNFVGPAGAWSADLLFQVFGLPSFLLVLGLAALAREWFRAPRHQERGTVHVAGFALCVIASSTLLAESPHHFHWRGAIPMEGVTGRLLASGLVALFNVTGAYILTFTFLIAGLFLCTDFSLTAAAEWVGERAQPVLHPLLAPFRALSAWRERRREARAAARRQRQLERQQAAHEQKSARGGIRLKKREAAEENRPSASPEIETQFVRARNPVPRFEDAAARARRELEQQPAAGQQPEEVEDHFIPVVVGEERLYEEPVPSAAEQARAALSTPSADVVVNPMVELRPVKISPRSRAVGEYRLPSPDLLQEPKPGERIEEEELRAMAGALRAKCDEFDVRGQVTQINPGPVVTTYEFKPEAGIKYNRITALNEDLCLALEAESIFIERIPGKSTVGIEVPNRRRETILLREVVESKEFHDSASPLTMALGKDINGHIVTADLASMPHLLIAGSTGSGKSVALNSIIVSLLYKCTPDQVRFILVDPKRLELGLYDGIPHLYTPIIAEPKLAANALRNATREMERRLKLLASKGVRNIGQYNRLFEEQTPGLFDQLEEDPDNKPLPYIVIIIDELADLMILDASNVEESITRLAQMARAVGIHLILATQRPSVDVITGLIKANFPARISFRVATKIDSRTILDAGGAESLLGKGDMLFLPPGTSRLHRVHGTFVTEKEITGVVKSWADQAQPEFNETFLKAPAEEGDEANPESGEPADDPMFEDAVRVVLEYGKASTSLLQRRLRIGYGRAAHLIDLMYADGIVGPADGPKPREVLKRPEWLAEVDSALR